MVAIFVASGMSDLPPAAEDVSDKTLHFVAYGGLGLLLLRAVAGARWPGVTSTAGARAWLIAGAYGASDEFHQWFVPNRSPSFADWIADAAGAALAIAIVVLVARLRPSGRAG